MAVTSAGLNVLSDLRAENDELDEFLSALRLEDWERPTPARGWSIRHQVAHLSFADGIGYDCVRGDTTRLRELMARGKASEDDLGLSYMAELLELPPAELLARWRLSRSQLWVALAAAAPNHKVPWAAGPMAVTSFATARLMESWAHGLDCRAAVGAQATDTARIWHVCRLGYRALPYAFRRAGREMPGSLDELAIKMTGPSGDLWTFGVEDAGSAITGSAGEWARVAVQRMPAASAHTLSTRGDLAEQALQVARAFA